MDEFDDDPIARSADRAADALNALASGPGAHAAGALQKAFVDAGKVIEDALVSAAATGELSLNRLGRTIAQTFAASLIDTAVQRPLEAGLSSVFARLPFFGARAEGGPVTPGGAFLVGERGPELFTPASAGTISQPAAGVTVNLTLAAGADAAAVRRSEGQIAAVVARAVARGQRQL